MRYKIEEISHQCLLERLSYDPTTGQFRWLADQGNRMKKGDVAGSLSGNGYWVIVLGKRCYPAHRLAWFYVKGVWPGIDIDHRDLDRTNNRWSNLRLATGSQNRANTMPYKSNTSGSKGVHFFKRSRKWVARIGVCGKRIHLGYRESKEEAVALYSAAAAEHYGEFARVG